MAQSKLAAEAGLEEARRKRDQAEQDIGDLNALLAKRDAAQAALGKAELDLSFCYVRAEFDALVVNLHTAIGQFVAPGAVPVQGGTEQQLPRGGRAPGRRHPGDPG